MPGGDGSGPRGEGSLTGRGTGICAGYPTGGYETAPGPGGGRGILGRRGGGRGLRNRYSETGLGRSNSSPLYTPYAPSRESNETDVLKSRIQVVAETIEQIAHRVSELLSSSAGKD